MRRRTWLVALGLTLAAAAGAFALTGKNGWTVTTVTTAAAIQANSTYVSGFRGVPWQNLARFQLWPPNNTGGQRDGLAVDEEGTAYVLVMGDGGSAVPSYTGLVKVAGSAVTTLVQDCMTSSPSPVGNGDRIGNRLDGVFVSPSDVGLLTKGHPVIRRWADETSGVNSIFPGSVDLVSVDPGTGAETFLYRFANLDHYLGAIAIDGSGTTTDGTIYVNTWDGSIARLRWVNQALVRDTLPANIVPEAGLRVGPDGSLFTCEVAKGHTWGVDIAIHRVDPATGATSVWGSVDGRDSLMAWDVDAGGTVWCGISTGSGTGKFTSYVTRGVPGGTTRVQDRIAESSGISYCLTTAAGAVYVEYSDQAVYALRPGTGGKGK